MPRGLVSSPSARAAASGAACFDERANGGEIERLRKCYGMDAALDRWCSDGYRDEPGIPAEFTVQDHTHPNPRRDGLPRGLSASDLEPHLRCQPTRGERALKHQSRHRPLLTQHERLRRQVFQQNAPWCIAPRHAGHETLVRQLEAGQALDRVDQRHDGHLDLAGPERLEEG